MPEDISYDVDIALHLRSKKEGRGLVFHIKIVAIGGIPCTYIILRMDDAAMEFLRQVILCFTKGEAVEMGMKDGLPEDAMFPKDGWSVVLDKKLLYLAFQRKQFYI